MSVLELHEFPGGIHPPEEKHLSNGTPIRDAGLPAQLVLPLRQHVGAPSEPVVATGKRVLRGQRIAEAAGPVSVALHAPSSGIVRAIEARPVPHPSNLTDLAIVIDVDGRDDAVDPAPIDDWRSLDAQVVLEKLAGAGIAGLGGAGFPTATKLAGARRSPPHTLILNGVECEPYITADDVLMRERADELITGVTMLLHLSGAERALVAIEDNKPEALAAVRSAAAAEHDERIHIVELPTRYPSGGEKQLIQILTGQEVPSGGLPAQLGILCQNVGTAVALRRAVELGEPLISRVTTVTGRAVDAPGNFDVRLGTPYAHLLEAAGLAPERLARLVVGGSMMGVAIGDTRVPVVKTTNCLLAATAEEFPEPPPEQPCIRCGACETVCPAGLLPQQLYWYTRDRDFEQAREHALFDCIECGACSWVCPSAIPLVQYYRHGKRALRQQDADADRAARSRDRFEAHQARQAAEAAEKEARRAARAEAARRKAKRAQQAAKDAPTDTTAGTSDASVTPGETPAAKDADAPPRGPGADRSAARAVVAAALERAEAGARGPSAARTEPAPDAASTERDGTASPKPAGHTATERIDGLVARVEKTHALIEAARAEGDDARAGKLEARLKGLETKLADARDSAAGAAEAASDEDGDRS